VSREAHPDGVEADPAGDLQVHDAQGDRDAEATVEDLVEVRVPRVVVVRLVPAEPLVPEEMTVHGLDPCGEWRRGVDAPGEGGREGVEPGEVRVDVEVGVRVEGDQEARLPEVDGCLGAAHRAGEPIRV